MRAHSRPHASRIAVVSYVRFSPIYGQYASARASVSCREVCTQTLLKSWIHRATRSIHPCLSMPVFRSIVPVSAEQEQQQRQSATQHKRQDDEPLASCKKCDHVLLLPG